MISIVQTLSDFVINFISGTGNFGVFLLMALESANIPIPSEVIMPFSGFLVYQGKLTFAGIVIAGTLGNVFGSVVSYGIGKHVGEPFILKYGKYLLIPKRKYLQAKDWFGKYGHEAVFIGRLLPVVRTFISLPAGAVEMDFKKFLIYTTIGCAIWTALLGYVGIMLGPSWFSIMGFFKKIEILVIIGLIGFVVWYLKHLKE